MTLLTATEAGLSDVIPPSQYVILQAAQTESTCITLTSHKKKKNATYDQNINDKNDSYHKYPLKTSKIRLYIQRLECFENFNVLFNFQGFFFFYFKVFFFNKLCALRSNCMTIRDLEDARSSQSSSSCRSLALCAV